MSFFSARILNGSTHICLIASKSTTFSLRKHQPEPAYTVHWGVNKTCINVELDLIKAEIATTSPNEMKK